MSTIICNVVDLEYIGLEGVHIVFECDENVSGKPVKFEAYTDEDGRIKEWCTPGVSTPQIVDHCIFQTRHMTISTGSYFGQQKTPLMTISEHLDNIRSVHLITFQFGSGDIMYNLNEIRVPITTPPKPVISRTILTGPMSYSPTPIQGTTIGTHEPGNIARPNYVCSTTRQLQPNRYRDKYSMSATILVRKRKLSFDEMELPATKRRRLE